MCGKLPRLHFLVAGPTLMSLSYDFKVCSGHDEMPGPGWAPWPGRKGTDREIAGRQRTELEWDRPFPFHQARTDTRVFDPDDKHGTAEKMSDNLPQTIGLDISKASLDCHVHPAGASASLPIPSRGIEP